MGQKASLAGAEVFNVRKCPSVTKCMYLAPKGQHLTECNDGLVPGRAVAAAGARTVRIVCISDTHNEHEGLQLPEGDILIHAGDCLTETGQRGYVIRKHGRIQEVKDEGIAVFQYFADWFGAQKFPNKVLIAGNHDLVLQGLGRVRVQQILDNSTTHGKCFYLEHEEVSIGGVRIFGSPFGCWGGKNDAFFSKNIDYTDVPHGIHVMVTHMPFILPAEVGGQDEDLRMTGALHRTGAVLHISGHCHWAHGLYQSRGSGGTSIPCVVASVCGSHMYGGPWKNNKAHLLASAQGARGDPLDRSFGGYNLDQPPIVCDIEIPALDVEDSPAQGISATQSIRSEASPEVDKEGKPAMLFFGPQNDPDFLRKALPRAREWFDVDFVDETDDGIQAVGERFYVACVAKLGSKGNTSYPIIDALRKSQGAKPFVAIHSATAAANPAIRDRLVKDLSVNLFVSQGQEDDLFDALEHLATR